MNRTVACRSTVYEEEVEHKTLREGKKGRQVQARNFIGNDLSQAEWGYDRYVNCKKKKSERKKPN